MYDLSKVVVTSSPHIKNPEDTRSIMLDVIIAMVPALAVAVFTFGARSLVLTAVTVLTCVLSELLYNKLTRQTTSIGDLSAVVTGMLLAFNMPVTAPLWMGVFGGIFAIIIGKMIFGGIGKNFMNPALAGRAFLMASFPALMTTWVMPGAKIPLFGTVEVTDAISTATPLSFLKKGTLPTNTVLDVILGQVGGCIGEVSALALLIGGLYLLYRKIISWHIPVAYIATVALFALIFPQGDVGRVDFMLYQVFSGGLFLGAIFMATDYATSPVTRDGKLLFGVGCGLLTLFIRYFGGLPEGVSYSILIMNALVWAIDHISFPRKFGYPTDSQAKAAKKAAEAEKAAKEGAAS